MSDGKPTAVEEEITAPLELADDPAEHDPQRREELEAAQGRYESDPAYRAMWKILRRARRNTEDTVNAARVTLAAELSNDVEHLKQQSHRIATAHSIAKWVLTPLIAFALGVSLWAIARVWDAGYQSAEIEFRLRTLERDTQRALAHARSTSP